MHIKLPDEINFCISIFEKAGFQAYAVGGCVRDILLGGTPDDYDIATNALPEQICALFNHVIATGKKFGTITIIINNMHIQATSFRSEMQYYDSRRPSNIKFGVNLEEDLSRRDFTINAMAYSLKEGLMDPLGGQQDLLKKIIRTVGNPALRFSEDALRILRAFRFAAKLDFSIEKNTQKAAIHLSRLLKNISIERIQEELIKILISPSPHAIEPLIKNGAFTHIGITFKNALFPLSATGNSTVERLAGFYLLCGCQSPALNLLRLDRNTRKLAQYILEQLYCPLPDSKINLKKRMAESTYEIWKIIFELYRILKNTDTLLQKQFLYEIELNHEPFSIGDLAINGNDIQELGIKSGIQIGKLLSECLKHVIEHPKDNTMRKLKEYILKNRE